MNGRIWLEKMFMNWYLRRVFTRLFLRARYSYFLWDFAWIWYRNTAVTYVVLYCSRRTDEFFNVGFAQKIGNGRGARVTAVSTLLCTATSLRRLLLRYFITFVKLDLVHYGNTIPVWRIQRWGEYFDVSGRKWQKTGKSCLMKNFVNCPYTVLLGWTK